MRLQFPQLPQLPQLLPSWQRSSAATPAPRRSSAPPPRGFTLIELAIVMAVVGLLMGAALMPLRVLDESRQRAEEMQRLEDLRAAVVGYALRHRTRPRLILVQGANGARVAANPVAVPAGRPYLPCPDIDGDGFEDRVPEGPNGFIQGVEVNSADDPVVVPVEISNGRPAVVGRFYGDCRAARGAIPWRTLGVQPADQWGNRHTYFADPVFAGALFGFDHATVADARDPRAPRAANLPPPLRAAVTLNTGLAEQLDRQCPAVVCAGGLSQAPGPNLHNVCVRHAQDDGCAWTDDPVILNNLVLKAGALAPESIPADSAAGNAFNAGDITEGLPLVILSHGPNGRGAVNHWASLASQLNAANEPGPICNRAPLADAAPPASTGPADDLPRASYPDDNHEAMNAVRYAPGNSSGDRRCPPVRGLADAAGNDAELLPSVFVWEPPTGGYGANSTYDDLMLWMTREELARAANADSAPNLPPLVFANLAP